MSNRKEIDVSEGGVFIGEVRKGAGELTAMFTAKIKGKQNDNGVETFGLNLKQIEHGIKTGEVHGNIGAEELKRAKQALINRDRIQSISRFR
ncbi:MAG: hypothetical protein MRY79_04700 [Alphaproteobacteria bacterium]|nr:hypothetical protein [Alphaproteobacteria bacterium]